VRNLLAEADAVVLVKLLDLINERGCLSGKRAFDEERSDVL
jgi:hypothetical protein